MPGPPLPLPVEPTLTPEARDAWRLLAGAAVAERPHALFWMAALRQAATREDHRTGSCLGLLLRLPGTGPAIELKAFATSAGIPAVAAALADYVAIARPLARVKAWLAGLGTLDAEARELLEEGDFATARYRLGRPGRLTRAHRAESQVEAYISEAARRV
jgi:hypothetical protein